MAVTKKPVKKKKASKKAPKKKDLEEVKERLSEILTGVDKEKRDARIRLKHNKKTILSGLKKHGITKVLIEWTGSGDSGGIERVVMVKGDEEQESDEVPNDLVEVYKEKGSYQPSGNGYAFKSKLEMESMTLKDAVEGMVYDWLEAHHGGWENNEGGQGEATFDVKEDLIEITHRTNIVTQETDSEKL